MLGVSIRNEINMRDKANGISFRRKGQVSTDVILNVLENVTQSNWGLKLCTYCFSSFIV